MGWEDFKNSLTGAGFLTGLCLFQISSLARGAGLWFTMFRDVYKNATSSSRILSNASDIVISQKSGRVARVFFYEIIFY